MKFVEVASDHSARPARAFTLIEVLLTLTVLLLVLAAMVVNFAPLQQGATLNEGANRLESLLRYAKAEAASTGRRVRVEFCQETNSPAGATNEPALKQIQLSWEANPISAPGKFDAMPTPTWDSGINDSISVRAARPLDETSALDAAPDAASSTNAQDSALSPDDPFSLPAITFFPDGSSDSAELLISSRDPQDDRTVRLQIIGPTGWVRCQTIATNDVSDASPNEGASDSTSAGEDFGD